MLEAFGGVEGGGIGFAGVSENARQRSRPLFGCNVVADRAGAKGEARKRRAAGHVRFPSHEHRIPPDRDSPAFAGTDGPDQTGLPE